MFLLLRSKDKIRLNSHSWNCDGKTCSCRYTKQWYWSRWKSKARHLFFFAANTLNMVFSWSGFALAFLYPSFTTLILGILCFCIGYAMLPLLDERQHLKKEGTAADTIRQRRDRI